MSKRSGSAARWREIVRGQAASGLSVAAYCRRTRVPQSSFFAWRRKLRDTARFAGVQVTPEPAGADGALQVRLAGGRGIVVRNGFDRQTLLTLLDTLENGIAGAADIAVREAGA
ncbi:MAG: transposase [Planctomycetes bacterium]|nr:transposase [Planctomycetota bacterium]